MREVRLAYNAFDEQRRRQTAHDRSNEIASWFQDPARGRGGRPDITLLTDETGRVIARDQDLNRMAGAAIVNDIPTLRTVLEDGVARHDGWFKSDEDKLLRVAMAPVRNVEGGVIGALVVGYDISNGLAAREAEVLGRSVAILREGNVYSSSLEGALADSLQSSLFGDMESTTNAALQGTPSSPWTLQVGDAEYIGVTAPLPETPSVQAAFAVLGNRTAEMELASVSMVILMLMGVGVLGVLIYGFIIGSSFLRPVEAIEEGVLTVINGRTDYRIDVQSSEFGGLAYRINQLINVFTGVEETDEEGHSVGGGGANWEGAAAPTQSDATTNEDEGLAAQLAAEPEDAYHERIYQEYVAAKKAAGEDVSNIPKDRFIGRLQKNAQNLVQKHGCRMVRFQVQTKGNQVILRPVIIR